MLSDLFSPKYVHLISGSLRLREALTLLKKWLCELKQFRVVIQGPDSYSERFGLSVDFTAYELVDVGVKFLILCVSVTLSLRVE